MAIIKVTRKNDDKDTNERRVTVLPSVSNGTSSNYEEKNKYTIGSQQGQNVAQNMGIGQTYTASDNSVWTKQNDGTITVDRGGQTFDTGYVPSDYSTLIRQQIAAGVPYQDVMNSVIARENKALNDPNLTKYAYDDVYNMAWNYILEGQEKENLQNAKDDVTNWMNEFEENNARPEAHQTDPRIEQLLTEILSREDFSYDVANDPLYQQYRDMYLREGDRAMRDTLAEVAAGAGGMNTYAITAAQQANNYYNSQLNDKIPELYQLAYNMYLNDKESMVQDLGLLQNMDATQYGRYRDTMNDWYNDKNFAYNLYQSALGQGNYQTNFDYNANQGDKNFTYNNYWSNKEFDYNDSWNNKEWDANQEDKEYNRNQTEIENAKADIAWLIQNGVTTIRPELIEQAGLTQDEVNQMIKTYQAQQAITGSGYAGSSGSSLHKVNDDRVVEPEEEPEEGDVVEEASWTRAVYDLGLPAIINATTLADLASVGAIYDDENGVTRWASDWSVDNWESRLNAIMRNPIMANLTAGINNW